jgi:hypothetical protein
MEEKPFGGRGHLFSLQFHLRTSDSNYSCLPFPVCDFSSFYRNTAHEAELDLRLRRGSVYMALIKDIV